MSCHFIIHNAHCLPFKLTCHFSLIDAHLHSLAPLRSLCPCSSVQTRAFTRSLLPSSHATEGACQCFALAHIPLFTCSLLPGCSRQLLPFPRLLFFSSTTPTSSSVTALHQGIDNSRLHLLRHCTPLPALNPGHCSASAHTPNPLPCIHPPATWPPGRLTAVPPLLPSPSQIYSTTPQPTPTLRLTTVPST